MSAWTELCRDRPCIACGKQDGTVVPAHANAQKFGKGMGLKAADWTCVPLCLTHHDWLDKGPASREEKVEMWGLWWISHMAGLLQAELVQVAGHVPRGTPRKPKQVDRPAYIRPSKVVPHSGRLAR